MTETFTHPLIHTPDPRQRTVERMAQAGFAAYHAHRPYTWANAVFATRKRWEIMAERILAGTIDTPRKLRDDYCEDMYGVPEFSGAHKLRWQGVLSAMRCVIGTSEVAA